MLHLNDINIRDPFILVEGDTYYMYGTRARNFGRKTNGFDVYVSKNLVDFSEPQEVFCSSKYNLNKSANWAPEVHFYQGKYYMLATFVQENNLRGTYILVADSPLGQFRPLTGKAATPLGWECLDGTLYVEDGIPYLVFCHEHTQILDGTICYCTLSRDLKTASEPVEMCKASSLFRKKPITGKHYVTDGPYLYRTKFGDLFMLWSTNIKGKYAECLISFDNNSVTGKCRHEKPLITNDGGHGMIFLKENKPYFVFHKPNNPTGRERPCILPIEETKDGLHVVSPPKICFTQKIKSFFKKIIRSK